MGDGVAAQWTEFEDLVPALEMSRFLFSAGQPQGSSNGTDDSRVAALSLHEPYSTWPIMSTWWMACPRQLGSHRVIASSYC